MKKNLILLIIFLLIGCTSDTAIITKITCPSVFFSAEHSKFIVGNKQPITLDNLVYKADINNHAFNKECSIVNDFFQTELSLLFIVKPDQAVVSDVTLPFYVAILDINDEVVDMQYYKVEGDLKSEPENVNYIETELIKTIKIQIPFLNEEELNQNKVVIGFMLDEKKLEILN